MDPASVIEAVPTEYGFEGYIAIVAFLAVIVGGGWVLRTMIKQNQKHQENALFEHKADREKCASNMREMNDTFTEAVTAMTMANNENHKQLSEDMRDLTESIKDMRRELPRVS